MRDAFDLNAAQIVNAPDVRAWPMTAEITKIWFDGSVSRFAFTKQDGPDRWPDVRPKGWTGDLQYTVWLFRLLGGVWVGSAFIQFWYGRDGSGDTNDPDVPSKYAEHWYYADRWAPLFGSGPIRPAESIGFMVTSGNARDSDGPYGPQERSNVVILPAADNGSFPFPINTAPPVDNPPSPVDNNPAPVYGDIQDVLAQLDEIRVRLQAIKATLGTLATQQDILDARKDFANAAKEIGKQLASGALGGIFGRREPPKKAKK